MEKGCSLCWGSHPGSCSCPSLHLWSAVRGSRSSGQGEGPARFPGCPRPPGAHRGALCGLRLGERRPGSEGRVRAVRSPPPPGEGSGRAAAAPQASALGGAQPADAVWVHGTHGRLSGAGSPAETVARASASDRTRVPQAAASKQHAEAEWLSGCRARYAALPRAGSLPACAFVRAAPGSAAARNPGASAPGALL